MDPSRRFASKDQIDLFASLAVSRDGVRAIVKWFVFGDEAVGLKIRAWDLAKGTSATHTFEPGVLLEPIDDCKAFAATTGPDRGAVLSLDGKVKQKFPFSLGTAAAEPDGERLALALEDSVQLLEGGVVKWKLEGQEYSRWKLVEWAGPGQLLIATEFPRKRVAIVDSETGEAVTEHHGLACSEGAMVSPDGRWLLNRYNTKKATSCIDLRSGVAFKGAPLTREFQAFAFSRTSGVLAGATEDGRVVLWSPELTEQLAAFESGLGAPGVCFSGDGRWLVLCDSENGTLATWETVALLSGALKPAATKAKPKPRPKATLKSRS